MATFFAWIKSLFTKKSSTVVSNIDCDVIDYDSENKQFKSLVSNVLNEFLIECVERHFFITMYQDADNVMCFHMVDENGTRETFTFTYEVKKDTTVDTAVDNSQNYNGGELQAKV